MNESMAVKERNDHNLLLLPAHLYLLGPRGSPVLLRITLMFTRRVVGEHPTLVTSHYIIKET